MTASGIRQKVIADKIDWIKKMLAQIKSLPIDSYESFVSDARNAAAAESYLRRALEALMDLGRHILAKGFAKAIAEYKEIPAELLTQGILSKTDALSMREMAGYRNRMVHFYNEIGTDELYTICSKQSTEIEKILTSFKEWIDTHPELNDRSL